MIDKILKILIEKGIFKVIDTGTTDTKPLNDGRIYLKQTKDEVIFIEEIFDHYISIQTHGDNVNEFSCRILYKSSNDLEEEKEQVNQELMEYWKVYDIRNISCVRFKEDFHLGTASWWYEIKFDVYHVENISVAEKVCCDFCSNYEFSYG